MALEELNDDKASSLRCYKQSNEKTYSILKNKWEDTDVWKGWIWIDAASSIIPNGYVARTGKFDGTCHFARMPADGILILIGSTENGSDCTIWDRTDYPFGYDEEEYQHHGGIYLGTAPTGGGVTPDTYQGPRLEVKKGDLILMCSQKRWDIYLYV